MISTESRLATLDARAARAAGPWGSPVHHRDEEHARLLERAGRWTEAASTYGVLGLRASEELCRVQASNAGRVA